VATEDPGGESGTGRLVAQSEPTLSATAAFELLSDETRIGIVRELSRSGKLRFSTLRERVGTEDSGQFNYHLERLRGGLVRKTDGGYELTRAGRALAEVVESTQLR
jgi:DNA-binding HxlR family transcriptional regulator